MMELFINLQDGKVSSHVRVDKPVIRIEQRPAPRAFVRELSAAFRRALRNSNAQELERLGGRLRRLLGQTASFLDVRAARDPKALEDLTLVLNEDAASLPWELTIVQDAPLSERYRCGRQVLTGSDGPADAPPEVRSCPLHILLVVNTSLGWACREIELLDRRLNTNASGFVSPPNILSDPDPAALWHHLAGKDIVHFAGHSRASDPDPSCNGWSLRGGVFSPAYIASQAGELECWPSLVFANTCPPTTAEDTLADPLAVSMLFSGVGHYIATLSAIEDSHLSAGFAVQVYEGLIRGETVGAAVSMARRWLTQQAVGDPPARNAGAVVAAHYVLYGNPAKRVFEPGVAAVSVRQPADRIGPYAVIAAAGQDASRVFYRANAPSGEVLAAIIRGQAAAGTATTELQGDLSRLRARLEASPLLVPMLDTGSEDDNVYLVQPPRGRGLDLAVRREGSEARRLVVALAEALRGAHGCGLRHGQLRPEAFEQDPGSDRWQLRDAGWAELRERHGLKGGATNEAYRSPEQWAAPAGRFDVAGDLWALAVIAFQVLAGRHPFGDGAGGWREAVTRGEASVDGLPPDLAGFFRRALARDTQHRFRTADEFLEVFRRPRASRDSFEPDLEQALKTRAGVFFVNTADEADTIEKLRAIAAASAMEFRTWSVTSGVSAEPWGTAGTPGEHALSPYGALSWLAEQQRPTMLAALDFDAYLDDWQLAFSHREQPFREYHAAGAGGQPRDHRSYVSVRDERRDQPGSALALPKAEVRRLLTEFASGRDADLVPHKLVIVAPGFVIPEDLNKHIHVFQARPAGRDDVLEILREQGAAHEPWAEKFAWYAAGLTASGVRGILRLARVRHGALTESVIDELIREKSQVVRRRGLLEFILSGVTLAKDVVGAHQFRWWVALHRLGLTDTVAASILPGQQGVVLGGLPGTGKTLCGRAIAGELGWPLLRLDVGRVFTGLLGGAEENLREALSMAEAMGPVVLLVDDLDRALGHGQGGGVSGRVMGHLLTWMRERDRGVFLAATISDPTALPVEVLGAGRFDRMFFFDLPDEDERAELVAHCLRRHGRSPDPHAPEDVAAATAWLSHADIAGRVEESLFVAAAAGRLEPSCQELLDALRRPEVTPEKQAEIQRLRRLWEGVERASGGIAAA